MPQYVPSVITHVEAVRLVIRLINVMNVMNQAKDI